jgi:chromosome segregation ATPase
LREVLGDVREDMRRLQDGLDQRIEHAVERDRAQRPVGMAVEAEPVPIPLAAQHEIDQLRAQVAELNRQIPAAQGIDVEDAERTAREATALADRLMREHAVERDQLTRERDEAVRRADENEQRMEVDRTEDLKARLARLEEDNAALRNAPPTAPPMDYTDEFERLRTEARQSEERRVAREAELSRERDVAKLELTQKARVWAEREAGLMGEIGEAQQNRLSMEQEMLRITEQLRGVAPDQVHNLQNANVELEERITDLENRRTDLNTRLATARDAIVELEGQLTAVQTEHVRDLAQARADAARSAEADLQQLREQRAYDVKIIEGNRVTIKNLVEELRQTAEEAGEHEGTLRGEHFSVVQKLRQELAEVQRRHDQAVGRIEEANRRETDLQKAFDEWKREQQEEEEKLAERHRNSMGYLTAKLSAQDTKLADREKTIADLKDAAREQRELMTQAEYEQGGEVSGLRTQVRDLETAVERLEQGIDSTRELYQQSQAELLRIAHEGDALLAERDAQIAQLKKAGREAMKKMHELEQQGGQHTAARQKIRDLEAALKTAQRQRELDIEATAEQERLVEAKWKGLLEKADLEHQQHARNILQEQQAKLDKALDNHNANDIQQVDELNRLKALVKNLEENLVTSQAETGTLRTRGDEQAKIQADYEKRLERYALIEQTVAEQAAQIERDRQHAERLSREVTANAERVNQIKARMIPQHLYGNARLNITPEEARPVLEPTPAAVEELHPHTEPRNLATTVAPQELMLEEEEEPPERLLQAAIVDKTAEREELRERKAAGDTSTIHDILRLGTEIAQLRKQLYALEPPKITTKRPAMSRTTSELELSAPTEAKTPAPSVNITINQGGETQAIEMPPAPAEAPASQPPTPPGPKYETVMERTRAGTGPSRPQRAVAQTTVGSWAFLSIGSFLNLVDGGHIPLEEKWLAVEKYKVDWDDFIAVLRDYPPEEAMPTPTEFQQLIAQAERGEKTRTIPRQKGREGLRVPPPPPPPTPNVEVERLRQERETRLGIPHRPEYDKMERAVRSREEHEDRLASAKLTKHLPLQVQAEHQQKQRRKAQQQERQEAARAARDVARLQATTPAIEEEAEPTEEEEEENELL